MQFSPSPPFSTEGLGPCELSSSHSTFFDYRQWVFWSTCGNDEVHCVGSRLAAAVGVGGDGDGDVIKNKIKWFLKLLPKTIWWPCLVQFWGLVKIGDKMYLTTRHQPFALNYNDEPLGLNYFAVDDVNKLCEYRKQCLKYLIRTVDDDDEISVDGVEQVIGGPLSRVFRSGLPEYAPHVRHYTSREYPLRDSAVGRVEGYVALPVYHHPAHHQGPVYCSGVLEIASSYSCFTIHLKEIAAKLQEMNMTIPCLSLVQVSSCQVGEIDEIDEALSEVKKKLEMQRTLIWTTSGEILSSRNGEDFIRKGQGVVGKAFSSKSVFFCRDIRQLSIAEYPWVLKARQNAYSASFAVCLQSSCSNSCIYVLEFFLPTNEKDFGDPRTLLHMLIETLKEHLEGSFKIASGQELGQKLTVKVIKVSPEDEFDSFEICNTTDIESTPWLGEVQGEEGMMQLDFSSQQVDAANGSMNGIHEQQNGSVGSTPRLATAQGGEGMAQVDFSSQQVDTANAYISVHGQQSGIVGSPPRLEHVQGFVNISYQESMAVQCNASNLARVDAANNSMNGIYERQNGIVGSSPRQEVVQNIENIAHDEPTMEIDVENPERDGASIEQSNNEKTNLRVQRLSCTLRSEFGITRELFEQILRMKQGDAAKCLGVDRSTLKRRCRDCDIPAWPPGKARKVKKARQAKQKVVQPATENIEEHHRPDTTRLEDDSCIWVKAEYQGRTMKFRLPLSARKSNLEEEVAQRLPPSIGSFKIEYQDEENDWIWIACDKDLNTCMNTLSSLGRTTIKMKVE